ncbi:LAFA_0D11254g1_1 [Lachancea sp. 'fantastica']|nr:LAFA_0D11254g1_1 [Lachancea sp. 'fantastica']
MSPSKKQPQNSGDRAWNVVNFDRNEGSQRNESVLIETVLEEGLCDDVLSTTSSDESESLIGSSNGAVAAGYGFSTLIGQKEEDLAKSLSRNSVLPSSLVQEKSSSFCGRASRGLAQLNPWQIVLLTSSTTFLITCALQAVLKNSSPAPVNDVAAAPYFTNHGATYRDVDFVLPLGSISKGAGKYIVDFENRIAYPIVPKVNYWESAKLHVSEKSQYFLRYIKELDKHKFLNLDNKIRHANTAFMSAANTLLSSCSIKIRSASDHLRHYKHAINFEPKIELGRLTRRLREAWNIQASGYLHPLQDNLSAYITKARLFMIGGGNLGSRFRAGFVKMASSIDQFRDRTGSVFIDKWDNTMAMLRFKANRTNF